MCEIFLAIFMRIHENFICIFIYLFIYLFIYSFIYLFIYLFIYYIFKLNIFYCHIPILKMKWIKIHKCLTEKIKTVLSQPKMKKMSQYLLSLQR